MSEVGKEQYHPILQMWTWRQKVRSWFFTHLKRIWTRVPGIPSPWGILSQKCHGMLELTPWDCTEQLKATEAGTVSISMLETQRCHRVKWYQTSHSCSPCVSCSLHQRNKGAVFFPKLSERVWKLHCLALRLVFRDCSLLWAPRGLHSRVVFRNAGKEAPVRMNSCLFRRHPWAFTPETGWGRDPDLGGGRGLPCEGRKAPCTGGLTHGPYSCLQLWLIFWRLGEER